MALNALIKFVQGSSVGNGKALIISDSADVNIGVVDNDLVASWRIELLCGPPGSPSYTRLPGDPLVLGQQANSDTPSYNLTPDVGYPGCYRIRVTTYPEVDYGGVPSVDIRNVCVLTPNLFFVLPPYQELPEPLPLVGAGAQPDELNFDSQPYGWIGDANASRKLLNRALLEMDSFLSGGGSIDWQDSVLERRSAPPVSPPTGGRYIIIATATGAWSGHEDKIVEWNGSSWEFTDPDIGMTTYVEDVKKQYTYNGTAWVVTGTGSGLVGPTTPGQDDQLCFANAGVQDYTAGIKVLNVGSAEDGLELSRVQAPSAGTLTLAVAATAFMLLGSTSVASLPASDEDQLAYDSGSGEVVWWRHPWTDVTTPSYGTAYGLVYANATPDDLSYSSTITVQNGGGVLAWTGTTSYASKLNFGPGSTIIGAEDSSNNNTWLFRWGTVTSDVLTIGDDNYAAGVEYRVGTGGEHVFYYIGSEAVAIGYGVGGYVRFSKAEGRIYMDAQTDDVTTNELGIYGQSAGSGSVGDIDGGDIGIYLGQGVNSGDDGAVVFYDLSTEFFRIDNLGSPRLVFPFGDFHIFIPGPNVDFAAFDSGTGVASFGNTTTGNTEVVGSGLVKLSTGGGSLDYVGSGLQFTYSSGVFISAAAHASAAGDYIRILGQSGASGFGGGVVELVGGAGVGTDQPAGGVGLYTGTRTGTGSWNTVAAYSGFPGADTLLGEFGNDTNGEYLALGSADQAEDGLLRLPIDGAIMGRVGAGNTRNMMVMTSASALVIGDVAGYSHTEIRTTGGGIRIKDSNTGSGDLTYGELASNRFSMYGDNGDGVIAQNARTTDGDGYNIAIQAQDGVDAGAVDRRGGGIYARTGAPANAGDGGPFWVEIGQSGSDVEVFRLGQDTVTSMGSVADGDTLTYDDTNGEAVWVRHPWTDITVPYSYQSAYGSLVFVNASSDPDDLDYANLVWATDAVIGFYASVSGNAHGLRGQNVSTLYNLLNFDASGLRMDIGGDHPSDVSSTITSLYLTASTLIRLISESYVQYDADSETGYHLFNVDGEEIVRINDALVVSAPIEMGTASIAEVSSDLVYNVATSQAHIFKVNSVEVARFDSGSSPRLLFADIGTDGEHTIIQVDIDGDLVNVVMAIEDEGDKKLAFGSEDYTSYFLGARVTVFGSTGLEIGSNDSMSLSSTDLMELSSESEIDLNFGSGSGFVIQEDYSGLLRIDGQGTGSLPHLSWSNSAVYEVPEDKAHIFEVDGVEVGRFDAGGSSRLKLPAYDDVLQFGPDASAAPSGNIRAGTSFYLRNYYGGHEADVLGVASGNISLGDADYSSLIFNYAGTFDIYNGATRRLRISSTGYNFDIDTGDSWTFDINGSQVAELKAFGWYLENDMSFFIHDGTSSYLRVMNVNSLGWVQIGVATATKTFVFGTEFWINCGGDVLKVTTTTWEWQRQTVAWKAAPAGGDPILTQYQNTDGSPGDTMLIQAQQGGSGGVTAGGKLQLAGGLGNSGGVTGAVEVLSGTTKRFEVGATGIAFFAGNQIAQQSIVKLTDSTGGSTDDTVSDVGASFNQATLNNNFAELTTKLNSLLDKLGGASGYNLLSVS